jgi:hypothetical protein
MKRTTSLIFLFTLMLLPAAAQQQKADRSLDWDEVVQPESEQPMRWPVGVAVASADELAVADAYGSRLIILARQADEWKQVREIALDGAPYAVAHDGNRYAVSLRKGAGLMAVEGERHQLRRIALPDGAMPGALTGLPGGGFLAYDLASGDVLKLDASGAGAGRWPVDGPVTGLAPAPNGGFFATVAHLAEVRFHGADGAELQRWRVPGVGPVPAWPTGIVRKPGGNLLVVDRHSGVVLEMGVGGRLEGRGSRKGWDPGLLRFPAGLAWLTDGRLAVVDQGNGRVQLFRPLSGDGAP